MIQLRTVLNVADNSGAKKILCVQVKGGSFRKVGTVGDVIVGAVREAAPNANIKKGDVVKAVIVRTKKEIRRSINSQLLTVFFLPLLLAGVHLAFAFPMIRRLLELFSLYNVGLFVTTTLVSFGAFALLYTIVYRLTAKAYYNIVSA